jgi:hypothetical protein
MMPDDPDAENGRSQFDLDFLVARVGNLYVRRKLSPPFHLREVAKHWRGISVPEIVEAIEAYFDANFWRFSSSGSGDQFLGEVSSAVRAAWQKKHPSAAHVDDEPAQPRRKRRGSVRPVPHIGGVDIYDDRDDGDAGHEDDRPSNAERPSGLVGYERVAVANLEDD